jgi:hypothetical protein
MEQFAFRVTELHPVKQEWITHALKNEVSTHFWSNRTHTYRVEINEQNELTLYVDTFKSPKIDRLPLIGKDTDIFEPLLEYPEMIPDETDIKPATWVDDEMIEDPSDTKPADWDEDASEFIVDPEQLKPELWDENAAEMIVDPATVTPPPGWNEEEDGVWEAKMIENPACTAPKGGCGPYTSVKIKNPAYKGKYKPRMIANPLFIGHWAPRMISNPNAMRRDSVLKFDKIEMIGIEGSVTLRKLYVGNILIHTGDDIAEARATGDPSKEAEVKKREEEEVQLFERLGKKKAAKEDEMRRLSMFMQSAALRDKLMTYIKNKDVGLKVRARLLYRWFKSWLQAYVWDIYTKQMCVLIIIAFVLTVLISISTLCCCCCRVCMMMRRKKPMREIVPTPERAKEKRPEGENRKKTERETTRKTEGKKTKVE